MSENKLKISNPIRVRRILRRICAAQLQVIIRVPKKTGLAIKGRAKHISDVQGHPSMRVHEISPMGMEHLQGVKGVQVEFVMMSTKVVFVAPMLVAGGSEVEIAMPKALVSIERRQNARFVCSSDWSAFLSLSSWRPHHNDPGAPPYFFHGSELGRLVSMADISQGGFCAVMRFPGLVNSLERGFIDDQARLIFPMRDPIKASLEVRWIKRIKEHIADEGIDSFVRTYRFGVEFQNPSEELTAGVRMFIQQISQADAI